jgi:hypothetical protein
MRRRQHSASAEARRVRPVLTELPAPSMEYIVGEALGMAAQFSQTAHT